MLSRRGRYQVVHPKGRHAKDPSPLKVKEVAVEDRRYVVCLNEDQRRKDAADREAIVGALREQLSRGDKSLVGNKGYRKYLKTQGEHFAIDEEKISGGGPLRRQVGVTHQHRSPDRRGRVEVQAALDGGRDLPLGEIVA